MAQFTDQGRKAIQEESVAIVEEAVAAVVEGHIEEGADVLRRLDGRALEAIFYAFIAESGHAQAIRGKKSGGEKGPSKKSIFARDGYCCRYCGTRTIDEDVWPVLDRSDLCHTVLGWDKNWPKGITHWVVWTLTASDEHKVPQAAGGPDTAENRVCACYTCQQAKLSRRLEDLQTKPGWDILDPSDTPWDGLFAQVPAIEASSISDNQRRRGQDTRVHRDDPGQLVSVEKVKAGMFIHFGQKSRYVVGPVDADMVPYSLGVKNAVPQRNGRWKISKTVRPKEVKGPIYLITDQAPVYDDPCD